jgi:hypothetical protein
MHEVLSLKKLEDVIEEPGFVTPRTARGLWPAASFRIGESILLWKKNYLAFIAIYSIIRAIKLRFTSE